MDEMEQFSKAYDELLPQIELHAVRFVGAVVLAAHDDTCVECHNADQRERCPLRRELIKTMIRRVARV